MSKMRKGNLHGHDSSTDELPGAICLLVFLRMERQQYEEVDER